MIRSLGRLLISAYLFFLSIAAMGGGMKHSFKEPVKHYLQEHGEDFTELVSFVVGILATSLVQSSSTVTSMAVVLTQESIVPLLISIGIVHGANLGTSVTSSIVAFFSETKPYDGNPVAYLRDLFFAEREAGFHRAVSTAVVHGLFNALLVTALLLIVELPFGAIHHISESTAGSIASLTSKAGGLLDILDWVSPKTYTKPVVSWMLGSAKPDTLVGSTLGAGLGLPGWALVILGFAFMFFSLRGFSSTMKSLLTAGDAEADPMDIGKKLLGNHPLDTFARGLVLTIMVQSSSATTSMVVPLAALGFFSIRQIFPFIMGANIGTTTTALIAASAAIGEPGFEEGMTIAMSHFYLNTFAVILVAIIPGLQTSVLAATRWLADLSVKTPAALLGYLLTMAVVIPLVVYITPDIVARIFLGGIVIAMLVWPRYYLNRLGTLDEATSA